MTTITASVDFGKPGLQHGHLFIPYSYNLSGWANLMIPITVIAHGQRIDATLRQGKGARVVAAATVKDIVKDHITDDRGGQDQAFVRAGDPDGPVVVMRPVLTMSIVAART